MKDFSTRLKNLPLKPGVYLMKDSEKNVIYVGKAKVLKNRVSSYFKGISSHNIKTRTLVENVDDFDYIVTSTEKEALILENNLIKKYKPRFNIRLKDDKTYPYIKITNEDYPKLEKVRVIKNDGARYFGPYTSALTVNRTIDVLNRIYPIRKCNRNMKKLYHKPSLYFHMQQCLAPCIRQADIDEYRKVVEEITTFLEKGSTQLVATLTEKMKAEAKKLNFERAKVIRDQIESLNSLKEKQSMTKLTTAEMDVISAYADGDRAQVVVFFVRNHMLFESEKYLLENVGGESISKILEQFILQFYGATAYIPKQIEVLTEFEDMKVFEEFLSDKKNSKVQIHKPQKGEKRNLVLLAESNAKTYLEKITAEQDKKNYQKKLLLKSLQDLIGLDRLPSRIEVYDISNIMGAFSVGSMVVYINAEKKTSEYRKFKIKTEDKIDDYGSIMEVIFRRHKRGLKGEKNGFEVFADLIIIDGGKGHVSSAKESLKALSLEHLNVAGLVKDDKHRTRAIYYDGQIIELDKHSELFRFLASMQEEVHRFAITYHKSLRTKGMLSSVLDNIDGVGAKRKANLLSYFGSIDDVKSASKAELLQADGMTDKVAENIVEYFKESDKED